MHHIKADLELALLHLKQLEERVAEQRSILARLRETGAPAECAAQDLGTLQENVQEVKLYIAQLTSNEVPVPYSSGRDAFVLPLRRDA